MCATLLVLLSSSFLILSSLASLITAWSFLSLHVDELLRLLLERDTVQGSAVVVENIVVICECGKSDEQKVNIGFGFRLRFLYLEEVLRCGGD